MDALIHIYAPKSSPRLRWIAEVFFKGALRVDYKLCSDPQTVDQAQGFKISYAPKPLPKTFHILPQGLLWEKELVEQDFYTTTWNDLPIFCQRKQGDLPFDPLAAAFFLVSRYEEYLPFLADDHGRFPAEQSFAFQQGFLNRPLINEWALALGKMWFGQNFELAQHYQYRTTVDIDNLFAYKGKGAIRTAGSLASDLSKLQFAQFRDRSAVLFGLKRDPFDTFRKQKNWNKKHKIPVLYFMLFAPFSQQDRNISPFSTEGAIKLREIADWAQVGIHPSYRSNSVESAVREEITNLQDVLRTSITQSRQHYLKMRTPNTFRTLVDLGITDDHTMGYAELPGFRASIANAYTFYDLELEAPLPLTLHPFAFMDSTYFDYLDYSAAKAKEQLMDFATKVRTVGGTLISVWHNRTFGESEPKTQGWVQLYKDFIHEAHH